MIVVVDDVVIVVVVFVIDRTCSVDYQHSIIKVTFMSRTKICRKNFALLILVVFVVIVAIVSVVVEYKQI